MDVVYVLGKGSLWKDNELRYSLRSIEKYLTGYDQVYIVGERPEWLKTILHIPFADLPKRKEINIRNKILAACDAKDVSEHFIFFNDDHFLLKTLDVADIFYWHSGNLEAKAANSEGSNKRKIENTIELTGGETLFYDIHVPIIYNKYEFDKIMRHPSLNWDEHDYLVKTLYAAWADTEDVETYSKYMSDCKISIRTGYDVIKEKIKDRLFFSVGPEGIKADMKRVLEELYPGKSKYEI